MEREMERENKINIDGSVFEGNYVDGLPDGKGHYK